MKAGESNLQNTMPIYEYHCQSCNQKVSLFYRGFSAVTPPRCPNCGNSNLVRLISKVAVIRSEESRLDSLSDPSAWGDVDENDPRSIARWARRMGREAGEDLGSEFDEMVERMDAGETPDTFSGENDAADDDFD